MISILLVGATAVGCGPAAESTASSEVATAAGAQKSVLFREGFESKNWLDRWELRSGVNVRSARRVTGNRRVFRGKGSLRVVLGPSEFGEPHSRVALVHFLKQNHHRQLYLRYYQMIEDNPAFGDFVFMLKGAGLYGWTRGAGWPANFDASNPKFTLRAKMSATSGPNAYFYYQTADGSVDRRSVDIGFSWTPDVWYCIELNLRGNTIGRNNGRLRIWIDDKPVWKETQLHLRANDEMRIQAIHDVFMLKLHKKLVASASNTVRPLAFWRDELVVSTMRIGCR